MQFSSLIAYLPVTVTSNPVGSVRLTNCNFYCMRHYRVKLARAARFKSLWGKVRPGQCRVHVHLRHWNYSIAFLFGAMLARFSVDFTPNINFCVHFSFSLSLINGHANYSHRSRPCAFPLHACVEHMRKAKCNVDGRNPMNQIAGFFSLFI